MVEVAETPPTREELAVLLVNAVTPTNILSLDDIPNPGGWLAVADVAIAAGARVRQPDVIVTLPYEVALKMSRTAYSDAACRVVSDACCNAIEQAHREDPNR